MIRIQFRILSLLIDRMELNTEVLMTVIVAQHLTQSKQSRYDYSPECSGLARCQETQLVSRMLISMTCLLTHFDPILHPWLRYSEQEKVVTALLALYLLLLTPWIRILISLCFSRRSRIRRAGCGLLSNSRG